MQKRVDNNKTIDSDLMKFIDKMGQFHENMGIPRIGGSIMGLMLIIDQPISPEDIANILKVSRSSISTNLKMLTIMGLAEKVSIAGSRKEHFTFSENGWENAILHKNQGLDALKTITEEGISILKKKHKSHDRLIDLMEMIQLDKKYIETMLEEWKEYKRKTKK